MAMPAVNGSNETAPGWAAAMATIREMGRPMTPHQMYSKLEGYYYNNATYDEVIALLQRVMRSPQRRARVRGLRNPAFRIAEFHATHLWPGETLKEAYEFDAKNARIEPAVRQLWEWSNWGARRLVFGRQVAIFGNGFIKVAQSPDRSRVFFRIVNPRHVTRFLTDDQDRGFLRYIRLDLPQVAIDPTTQQEVDTWRTEIWEKSEDDPAGRVRIWPRHRVGRDASLMQLGTPAIDTPLTFYGIDFIPIVHAPFRDVGEQLGIGAFQLSLEKIDEVNRLATELHRKLFRYDLPTWYVASNMVDGTGQPLPAPEIEGLGGFLGDGVGVPEPGEEDKAIRYYGEEAFLFLPGKASVGSLIPNIRYEDSLKILEAAIEDLSHDMPEMAYAQIRELAEASGVSIRYRMSGAIDRVIEARGNVMPAFIRACQMGVTIGQLGRAFGTDVGDYNRGELAFSLKLRPVIPESESEQLDNEQKRATIAVTKDAAGWDRATILREAGYTEQEVTAMLAAKDEQSRKAQETMQRAFARGDAFEGEELDDDGGDE